MKRWTAALALGALAAVLLGARLSSLATAAPDSADKDKDTPRPANQLTEEEKKAGWKLLFDGNSLDGWHNFKREGVRPGWQVKDGNLTCVDPHQAGDIVTTEKYAWFELELDNNISKAGNSGVMYHVTDEGSTLWQTG